MMNKADIMIKQLENDLGIMEARAASALQLTHAYLDMRTDELTNPPAKIDGHGITDPQTYEEACEQLDQVYGDLEAMTKELHKTQKTLVNMKIERDRHYRARGRGVWDLAAMTKERDELKARYENSASHAKCEHHRADKAEDALKVAKGLLNEIGFMADGEDSTLANVILRILSRRKGVK